MYTGFTLSKDGQYRLADKSQWKEKKLLKHPSVFGELKAFEGNLTSGQVSERVLTVYHPWEDNCATVL